MNMHGLLVLYRSISRNPLYAALNVLGLAAGIAVFLVLSMVVRYESSFDRWLPQADQVYRLDATYLNPGQAPQEAAYTSFVALPLLRSDYPQIAAGTREMDRTDPVAAGDTIDSETVNFVDPSFFSVIALPLLEGDATQALASPGSIVISRAIAVKYFGTQHAVGRALDVTHEGVKRSYTVTAVLRDLPPNSTLKFGILLPLTPAVEQDVHAFTDWGSTSGSTYLRFRSAADAHSVSADFVGFLDRRAAGTGDSQLGKKPEDSMRLSLVNLPDAHFHDIDVDADLPGADRRVVLSLGLVGLLALITAAINYVNLATARSGLRAREVALRKVMGATRTMLLGQFLGEAVALVAVAALIGLALTELAVPMVNLLGGWGMRIDYLRIIPLLAALVIVVGLGAGAYPAILLANYQPAAVLASARTPAGGRLGTQLRNLLVLAQFTSAIAFAICTLVIDAQARFLGNADRGFERSGLIIIRSLDATELKTRQLAITDALRRVPGVVAATLSDREPDSNNSSETGIERPGMTARKIDLVVEQLGDDYVPTYGVHLLAGRWFDKSHRSDDAGSDGNDNLQTNTTINRGAVAALGYSSPQAALGQVFTRNSHRGKVTLTVVGVVADVRFMSPREPVGPQFYLYETGPIQYGQAAVRFAGVPSREMMQRLQDAWRKLVPDYPFIAQTADQRLADYYVPDQQRARLFSVGAVLAIGIACLGLFGLASFSTARRMKEIGIRKVLGASSRDVLVLLVGQFIQPVLIASVIALPIAWIAMRGWLAGFDQRIGLSPLYFIAAIAAALAIAVLTVIGQALRVAGAEPARALRYE